MTPNACATEDNQPFSHFLPPSRGDSSDTPSSLRGRIKGGGEIFFVIANPDLSGCGNLNQLPANEINW
jgi:hypothetical protein